MNLLIQISASISCYKVCDVISQLKKEGHEVKVVLSKGAAEFIGKATLEGLSGQPVATNIFMDGEMMSHITLARWADLICLMPASANQINRLSQGLADDLIGAISLANNYLKPYWIFPAMNSQMLLHPATKNSLSTLENWGARVFPTGSGTLACGETGEGRLLEPALILEEIKKFKELV
jgi:phosphopantothenoylcysteine decarboxylase/phosphopantothenate--cysteine ligase